MKTLYLALFLLLSFTWSSVTAQTRSYKRGVSYDIPYQEDILSLSEGTSWFYNWGTQPKSQLENSLLESGMDFLPMAWNGNYNEAAIRAYLTSHPNVKYLLGFNEPNFKAQANMTPAEAAEKWSQLEKIADDFDLKLVGPAVNYSPDAPYQDPIKYLDEFFALLPNARVDFVAVHCYMPYPSALMWYIGLFKKYGRPIWLTEFCAWDNFWEISGDAATNQMEFMVDALNYLEADPDVYRYAWFIPRTAESDKWPFMQLLEDNRPGVLTDLGKVFVHLSSQDKSHYFSIGEQIPAEHYSSMNIVDVPDSDHWKSSVKVRPTTDESGNLEVYKFKDNRWVEYLINVPSTEDYTLTFRYSAEKKSVCKILIDGNEMHTLSLTSTGSNEAWITTKINLTMEAGERVIRFQVTEGDICMNWWSYLQTDESAILSNDVNKNNTFFYPSVVSESLFIKKDFTVKTIALYDFSGSKIAILPVQNYVCNLAAVSQGVYVIKADNKNDNIGKIIKR